MTLDERRYIQLGYLSLTGLGLLASYYYLERTCFLDASFILVNMLMRDGMAIEQERYTSALTQIVPLLASKAGVRLGNILLLYSLTFVLWPLAIFAVVAHWLGLPRLALGLALASVLMLSHGFFWIPNQIQLGIWLTVLVYGILWKSPPEGGTRYVVSAYSVALLVVFAHPLSIIPFVFMHGFFLLQRREWRSVHAWGLPAFAIVAWITKTFLLVNPYDSIRYHSLSNLMSHFPDYLRIESNNEFLSYVGDSYYFAVILLFLNGLYYLGTQRWLKLSWMLLFFFGYLLLINVSLLGGVARFYVELQYQPLAFFIAIPFAIDVLPAIRLRKTAMVMLVLLFASRLLLIVYHSAPYRIRLAWHRAMIERLSLREGNRYLIEESDAPVRKLILTWGSGYESLLVSSIGDRTRSITYQIDEEPERFDVFKDDENVFHTEWKTFRSSDLPARYFALEPHRYEKLTNKDIVP
jgi:hypothetical protein